jgi:ATPase subunit of ABC transporter with duplicated ATPase domains
MPQFIYTMKGLGKVHPPDAKVLEDIWLSFYFGAKIGVLGLNGAGKSSLLKIMSGEDQSFIGEAFPGEGISIGFLHQEPRLDPAKDVRGNVEEGVADVKALLQRYDDVNARLGEDLSPDDMEKVLDEQSKIQDKIDATNAWDLDSRLELAMDALRLPPPEADVTTLSGGERRRVALCRLLLQSPDLLLLDEPTNHLDAESVAWLERFLKDYAGTVVAVTHDRYFLDNVAGWILELDRGRGIPWEGNYSSWLEQKQNRLQQEEKAESRKQRTLERELEWIRMSPRARQAKGKARLNAYEELLREESSSKIETAEIYIAPGPRLGDIVVEARGVRQGLRRQPADRKARLHAAARRHRRRDRPQRRGQDDAVPDDHRAGETRRGHAADRRDRPHRARRSEPRGARREQDGLRGDHRRQRRDRAGQAEGRLARLRLVVQLQGRQPAAQGRHAIGRRAQPRAPRQAAEEGSNLLLLDEPTNDLDVDTLRALEEALLNFAGCAVVISHDRWFLDRIATHMLAFEGDSQVVWFEGNYQDYEADRKRRLGAAADQPHRIKYRKLTR